MKLAFLFPGQGAQKVGMGIDFAENFPKAKVIFEQASSRLDKDIYQICKEGPEDVLKDTRNTQPCIVTVSCAILEVFKEIYNISPDYVAGHSVGEYSALVAGGILSFEDSLFLVNKRAEFMQDAADVYGKGSMAAIIGLDDDSVRKICSEKGDGMVQAANFNSPGQVVISGDQEKIQELLPIFKEAGAKLVKELAVSGPWHSRFMDPAKEKLNSIISEFKFQNPNFKYISNVTAKSEESGETLKELLVKQLDHPVLWTDSINFIKDSGIDLFLELGPGKVLTGLLKRIDRDLKAVNIEKIEDIDKVKDFLEA